MPSFLLEIPSNALQGVHEPLRVLLSFLIILLSSYTALTLSAKRLKEEAGSNQKTWLLGSSLCLGMGIWAMHFMAMLAFTLPLDVRYDPALGIFSLIIAVTSVSLGLSVVTRFKDSTHYLWLSGFFVGLGIAGMHYTGMASMRLSATIHYNPKVFFLSLVIAIIAATAALFLLGIIAQATPDKLLFLKSWSSLLMACAAAGMHYTAMAGTVFIPTEKILEPLHVSMEGDVLAFVVTILMFMIMGGTLWFSLFEEKTSHILIKKNQELEKWLNAIEQSSEVIMITDPQGIVDYVNPAYEQMTLFSAQEIIGERIRIMNPEHYSEGIHQAISDCLQAGKSWKGRVTNLKKGGDPYQEQVSISPVKNAQEKITDLVIIRSDITKEIQIESALKRSKAEADDALLKAIEASQAKSVFLANMSHELRTPLNGILGMSQVLLTTNLNAEQHEYTNLLHSAGEDLLSLVNNLLDLSKIESKKIVLECETFNFRSVIKRVIDSLNQMAKDKGLKLLHSIEEDVPEYLIGDPLRLRQICINLIGNALKFTSEGEVELQCHREGGRAHCVIRFSVRDTGIGISKEQQGSILERFTQADDSTTRRYGGSGLGTTISKELVELMGGKLWLKSELGKGTVFYFTTQFEVPTPLDLALLDAQEKRKSSLDAEKKRELKNGRKKDLEPYSILIAEDNKVNQIFLQKMLVKNGYSSSVAKDGKEAVQEWSHGDYDLILMDVHMPEMGGLEATRTIRDLEKTTQRSAIPIIAATALAMKGDEHQCLNAGMNAYLSKPIDEYKLYEVLKKYLPEKERQTPSEDAEVLPSKIPDKKGETLPNSKVAYDLSSIFKMLDYDMDEIKQLVHILSENIDQYLVLCEEGFAEGNSEKVVRAAHTLKGDLANIGAKELRDDARELELCARVEILDAAQKLFPRFKHELLCLKTQLQEEWDL